MGLKGYVKHNNPNYHHFPWQLYTFIFVKVWFPWKYENLPLAFHKRRCCQLLFYESALTNPDSFRYIPGDLWLGQLVLLLNFVWYSFIWHSSGYSNFCRSIVVKHLCNTKKCSRIQPIERWYVITVRTCTTVTNKTFSFFCLDTDNTWYTINNN